MMPEWLASQVLAVLVAWLIDLWLGEPSPRWHPVVWMGHRFADRLPLKLARTVAAVVFLALAVWVGWNGVG